jgi:putative acetyltransferase
MPFMLDAQKLYRKVGFENINAPMGSTGHTRPALKKFR